ncbi:ribonuclease III [Legionella longbeachae]|uniref:Ribonuclease 3 n=1 Tax=Legionella longbeachae serogroup 1 (strain NSW150) TaxID=661367 RepID=D3HRV9_LEGLN|nr:ribonuclease III [Legionella longbeachae]VEE02142.1 ribonuclease III [Legionella oakridgensis]HBD7396613.1 ribonuclease III [Legionella pneumophila]ARB91558.1 ribonuclease III [Legionella longbeachae]ARM35296.1 ribonuclease III [Legionella longbeachae]EEZ95234.1 ribonuclease III [Legionella longbeachae D-4968]
MKIDLERLCRRLGYHFKNSAYLKQALTHCSVGSENYERFEFLGDSILSFVIANELFHRFPLQSEGQLSRLRSFLVRGEMLVELAKEIELGDFLFLGQGELKSGGFRRASILSDALEAVFAAVFLDGGIDCAKEVILKLYRIRLESPNLNDCLKDAKTQLQEYLQAEKIPLPEYILTKIEGDEHNQIFYITCSVNGMKQQTFGQGSNRRKAEQLAAKAMLERLRSVAP